MIPSFRFTLVVLILSTIFASIHNFTLDSERPLVKKGNSGSYFGYSVSQHFPLGEEKPTILVGAPLDQNLQPDTKRSGAIWRCPVTQQPDDCQQIPIEGKVLGSDSLQPPRKGENKTDQWLGVTLNSQGGKVITCAHRYIKDIETGYGQGLCYTLTPGLEIDEMWEPCRGRPTTRPLEEFGYCQAGTSGMMVGDWGLIGSPGPMTARGTAFLFDAQDNFLKRDKTFYHAPLKSPLLEKYSYLGMSVSGYKSSGTINVVAGAPRAAGGRGAVFLFSVDQPSNPVMKTLIILDGDEQSFSNFGYEVALADVDGNGYPDLLIGAPEYFEEDKIGGAVFLYFNNPDGINKGVPLKLTGGEHESRFGLAISTCGDLNDDGFDDFAIAAPYADNGAGHIFIYLGSSMKDKIISTQVLKGVQYGLIGLGLSLSGGADMDKNGMPDLLAGANGAALLFRARTLIPVLTKIGPEDRLTNISVDTCFIPFTSDPCFSLEVCLSLNVSQDILINYKLEGDTKMALPRIYFAGLVRSSTKEGNLVLGHEEGSQGVSYCSNYTIFIRRSQRHIRKPISFRLRYSLPEKEVVENGPDGLPILEPQLDPSSAIKLFEATFSKDCGQVCYSNLLLSSNINLPKVSVDDDAYLMIMGKDKELDLHITVQNKGMNAYEAMLIVTHSEGISFIRADVNKKHASSYLNKTVSIFLGDPVDKEESLVIKLRFSLKSIVKPSKFKAFHVFTNTTSEILKPASMIDVWIRSYYYYQTPSFIGSSIPEQLSNSGEMVKEVLSLDDIGSRVEHMYNISNQGERELKKLKVTIDWPYLFNFKSSNKALPLRKVLLYIIEAPTVIGAIGNCTTFKGQVNPLELPESSSSSDLENEMLTVNDSVYENKMRKKRETEKLKNIPRKIQEINCEGGHTFCLHFNCYLEYLNPGKDATILVKARISNETLVTLAPTYKNVFIQSRALLSVNTDKDTYTEGKHTSVMANAQMTISLRPRELAEQEISIWIYIVASLLGLFVFGSVAVILMFCGFFNRRKKSNEEIEKAELENLYPEEIPQSPNL